MVGGSARKERHVPRRSLTIEQVLTLLAETPPRIAELSAGLTPAQLRAVPAPNEWSANDVLAHLRACADVWGNCILAIVTQDTPTLRAINPTTWIKKTDYREREFQPSLRAFTGQRKALQAALEPLAPEGWSRTATVTGAGKPRQRTVMSYARWLVNHKRSHLNHIARLVATMHDE